MYNNLKNLKLLYLNQLQWIVAVGILKNDWKFEKIKFSKKNFLWRKWRIFWNIEIFGMKYSKLIKNFNIPVLEFALYHGNCLWSNFFFPSILWWIQSGNHPIGNWAKLGYKLDMKVLKNKKSYYDFGHLFELIIKIWPLKTKNHF